MTHRCLPAWTYTSPEFFELEREELFMKSWQLVCHESNIPDAGDYFTFDMLGQSVIAIRAKDGRIGTFHNFCRHRAARLLDGSNGNCGGRVTCPYHAWTYGLDGQLIGVPHLEEFGDLDKSTHGLKPVEMETWHGFIFIRFDGDGPGVAEQFTPYADEISHYNMKDLQPLDRVTMRPRNVNWKNVADNYVDAQHIPFTHPGLSALFGKTYGIEVKGDIHKMWGDIIEGDRGPASVRAYRKFLPDVRHLPEDKKRHWVYYRMWPNLAFDIYPDQIDFMQFIPISATETMIREIPYALKDDRREMKAARYLNWRINREVNREDTDLINRVQHGMETGQFSTGPLSEGEILLIDSAERMRREIPMARMEEPGSVA